MTKLTEPVKTMLDEETALLFQQRACRAGCGVSELMRDMIYLVEHGATFGEYVAKTRRELISGKGPVEFSAMSAPRVVK